MDAPDAPRRDLLRLLTCGSVDDGKSTLIGRLLHDTRQIMDDTLAALARDSARHSARHGTTGEAIDLALLTDGLEAEREQGITIDVAHRFFGTPRRAFIVADTPGHEQYTRNMATGASTAELAVILVDARKGLLTQTKRHSTICALLGIRHVVLAVNKIDLVGYDHAVFERIVGDYAVFAGGLGFAGIVPIPLSARLGDNVAARSGNTAWYRGPTLLAHLETVETRPDAAERPFRFPVQWVNRAGPEFRGLAGVIASGAIAVGDAVVVAASGKASTVARIYGPDGDVARAGADEAVTLVLGEPIDVARGDLLVPPGHRPQVADQFAAHVLWMDEEGMLPGRQYLMRAGHRWTPASVTTIKYRLDVDTLEHQPASRLDLNEIGFCNVAVAQALAMDPYAENRQTGAFILVDRFTDRTAGCGMVAFPLRRATNVHHEDFLVDKAARAGLTGQAPRVLWFTGLSGSGKSTVSKLVEQALHARGRLTYTLDGDNLRHGLNRDLGFTDQDRVENIRRVGEVARLFVDAGLIVLCSFISPFRAERRMVRDLFEAGEFIEIYVDTPLAECIRRDPKGLYRRAISGAIPNFTGISGAYEPPEDPDIVLSGDGRAPDAFADQVLAYLERHPAPDLAPKR